MPVHFAAARCTAHSPIARALAKKALRRAANDNGSAAPVDSSFDTMMRAALRHFAEHGLGAAQAARKQAEQAHFAGDKASYEWWLGVCRALDRRLADKLDRTVGLPSALIH